MPCCQLRLMIRQDTGLEDHQDNWLGALDSQHLGDNATDTNTGYLSTCHLFTIMHKRLSCCTNKVSKYVYLHISLLLHYCRLFSMKKKERRRHDAINNVYDRTRTVTNQSDHDICNPHSDDNWWQKPVWEKSKHLGKTCDVESQITVTKISMGR